MDSIHIVMRVHNAPDSEKLIIRETFVRFFFLFLASKIRDAFLSNRPPD